MGYYQVRRDSQPRGRYSVMPNIKIVLCSSNMMILERGMHSSYVGISSHVRLPPANQKLLFLFICDAKIRIIECITWQRYIHPRILILRSHS